MLMKNKSILGFKELWASKVEKKWASKIYRKKFQFFQNRVLKMFRIVKKDAGHFHHNLSMKKNPWIFILLLKKKSLCRRDGSKPATFEDYHNLVRKVSITVTLG